MKSIRLFALAIPALAVLAINTAQAAEPSCKSNVAEVQKQWDKVYHRETQGAHPQVKDNFRIAKEYCQKGDEKQATSYLDVVRGHLNMPVIRASGTDRVPTETLHSDGPTEHHDAKTTPAMGSTPGSVKPEAMHSDGPSTHHDPQMKK